MLNKIGEDTSNWGTILVYMICCRLDSATLRHWESHHSSKEVPTYDELIEFLRNQCSVLQSIAPTKPQLEIRRSKHTVSHTQTSVQSTSRCPFCGDGMHSAFKCQRFLKMKVAERYENLAEAANYLSVAGIGGSVVKPTKVIEAVIAPRSASISTYNETVRLHVLSKLTSVLPIQPVNIQQLAIPNDITLADPCFNKPGPIDMIIGAELYYDLLVDGRMKLSEDGPTLQQTVFGWVVSGRVPGRLVSGAKTHSHSCATADIRDLLARFWDHESCHSKSTYSPEESACEDLFARTTTRDEDGKYVVTLPKKDYLLKQLGESKSIALKHFLGLEIRFELKPEWKAQYKDFIAEYLKLGHMRPVSEETEPSPAYYLPHHAVIKPDSLTTKLRVVFDASCKTSTGISLNDALMVGPVVQEDLLSISIRFHLHRIAVVADVVKMYRMVKVHPHDQHLQRILWRNTPDEPIGTYELTTVTYGTASLDV
ncbi:uncharacterized protein LOC129719703 [Wyeomyia smithii]|uniref:uncharacterized protein LOC129719703 n=1 Tax=Wyeomyia smithii TaxID=174621 RepID=UPI002467D925|nr:uncharacterized protein LOC129719703 [Wyeomyia smithii]